MSARVAIAAACALALHGSCRPAREGKVEEVRAALVRGDAAVASSTADPPACRGDAEPSPCLANLVAALDPHGVFSLRQPDDATLAAVGLWVLRTHRGDAVPGGEAWRGPMAGAVGPGADVLRLSVATVMEEEARVVRKEVRDEVHAKAFAEAVAGAIPGAAARSRATGVSWSLRYEGAAEDWVTASQALDLGQDRMTGDARVALGRRMGVVRVATSEIEGRRAEAGDAGPRERRDAARP